MEKLRTTRRDRSFEIIRNFLIFFSGTFISRVFGFLREIFIAFSLGATHFADILYVSFRIPNFLRDIVAENAIQTAFVPSYIKWKEKKEEAKCSSNIFLIYLIFSIFVVILGVIFSPLIVKITAFGFTKISWKYTLTVKLTRILFFLIIFLFLSAFFSGILNAEKKFFPSSFSPAIFNITFLVIGFISYIYFKNDEKILTFLFGIGLLIGIVMQFVFLLPFVLKEKFFKFIPSFKKEEIKKLKPFLFLLFPVILSTSLNQVILFISTLLSSLLGEGKVAVLNYAYRVMHLPIAFLGVGIAVTTLPDMVKEKEKEKYLLTIYKETIFLLLPVIIFMIADSYEIIKILYKRGAFTEIDTYRTSGVLIMYSFSILFFSLSKINLNYFYSQNKIIEPMLSFLFSTSSYILFAPILSKLLDVSGLALSSSIASFTQFVFLLTKMPSFISKFPHKFKFFIFLLIFSFILYIKLIDFIIIELTIDSIFLILFYLIIKKIWR
ncbi:MAG: murein biosynthesis integral membrane protein MurJ [candidate division WOR-3 bacterium]